MLPRVLEPEVMDGAVEADAYAAIDHTGVNGIFVDDLLAALRRPSSKGSPPRALPPVANSAECLRAIDLGTGPAHIPLLLCQSAKNLTIVGCDLSWSMLQMARELVAAHQLEGRIALCWADAKGMPFVSGSFDLVFHNSLVHHLAEPRAVILETWRLCRAEGDVFVRDLIRPESQAAVDHLVAQYGGTGRGQTLFKDSLHAALTVAEVQSLVASVGGQAACVQATSDRHWTWSERKFA